MSINSSDIRNVTSAKRQSIQTLLNGTMSSDLLSSPADRSINVVIRVRPLLNSDPETGSARKSARSTTSNQSNNNNNNKDHSSANSQTAITFPAAGQIEVEDAIANTTRSFAFNVVFEPEATQEEVFEHSGVKRLTDMALDGFACTVFAYGQTSTGKTYTLTGNLFQFGQDRVENVSMGNRRSHQTVRGARSSSIDRDGYSRTSAKKPIPQQSFDSMNGQSSITSPPDSLAGITHHPASANNRKQIGIIQLAFAYLFEQIKRRKIRDKVLYVITVSYLEVYNEQVYDLLNPSAKPLPVRWSKERGFYAENLFKIECEDIGDLEGVLEEGCKNRQVRSHSMNENSSRSHAVMTINLASEMPDPEDPQGFIRKEGRFCLVDLAGSEKTKRTNSKGGTFIEANNINCSLLVLGNCIACLADSKRRTGHIPYRDSTLTKLLADSLSGNGMTLMVACVSPLKSDAQETINTLRYASRAKRVKMNPVIQMDPRELLILSLKREVRLLRVENNFLRQQQQLQLQQQQQQMQPTRPQPQQQPQDGDTAQYQNQHYNQHEASDEKTNAMNDSTNNGLDNAQTIGTPNGDSGIVAATTGEHYPSSNRNRSNSLLPHPLLIKYMEENEVLRVENVELNLQHNRLIRDHELVCRENERLLKKFHGLLSRLGDPTLLGSLSADQSATLSGQIPLPVMPSLLSFSASSPSLVSLRSDEDDEMDNGGDNVKNSSKQHKQNQVTQNQRQHLSKQQQSQPAKHDKNNNINKNNNGNAVKSTLKSGKRDPPSINNNSNSNNNNHPESNLSPLDSFGLDLTIQGKSAPRKSTNTTNHSTLSTSGRTLVNEKKS